MRALGVDFSRGIVALKMMLLSFNSSTVIAKLGPTMIPSLKEDKPRSLLIVIDAWPSVGRSPYVALINT
jgi:hypothetical protein